MCIRDRLNPRYNVGKINTRYVRRDSMIRVGGENKRKKENSDKKQQKGDLETETLFRKIKNIVVQTSTPNGTMYNTNT